MSRGVVLAISLVLGGCGIAQKVQLTQQWDNARGQMQGAVADCDSRYPPGRKVTIVERAQCLNKAMAIMQPYMHNPDLVAQFMAYRIDVAEQARADKITVAQAGVLIAEKWSQVVAEDQQRALAGRAVAAQEQNAAAANTYANTQLLATGLSMMNGR